MRLGFLLWSLGLQIWMVCLLLGPLPKQWRQQRMYVCQQRAEGRGGSGAVAVTCALGPAPLAEKNCLQECIVVEIAYGFISLINRLHGSEWPIARSRRPTANLAMDPPSRRRSREERASDAAVVPNICTAESERFTVDRITGVGVQFCTCSVTAEPAQSPLGEKLERSGVTGPGVDMVQEG